MQTFIELWSATDSWLKMTKEERGKYFEQVGPALQDLMEKGVEIISWGENEKDTTHRAEYDFFAVWKFPSEEMKQEFEELVDSSAVNRTYGLPLPIGAKMTDVPSHSWVLPTLLNHSGIKFLQLGCNPASNYPRFPKLFWWEGPDGSKILCHYTPLYGSDIKPTKDWPFKNYLAMQMTGDNHGPPIEKDIDKLLAYAEKEMPGIKVHFGTLDDFAKAIIAETKISLGLACFWRKAAGAHWSG